LFKEETQPLAHNRMIIGNDNTNHKRSPDTPC
jgi:hypothetical protein